VEIMLGASAVANLIREGKIYQLPNVIRTSTQEGMQTRDQCLVWLYLEGVISGEAVLSVCQDREEVERMISTKYQTEGIELGSGQAARAA